MFRRGTVCLAALVVIGLGACGGDDDDDGGGGSDAAPKEPVARCTPAGNPKSIAIKPKWKIGDRRTVEIQKSREDTELDEPVHVDGTAQVQVIDTGSKGSSLRWQAGAASFPSAVVLAEEGELGKIEEDLDPLRIEYATDADGAVEAVGNLSSLRTQVSAMLTALGEAAGEDEESLANLRRVVESDAFLQTAMIEDPATLHSLYGVTLARGETISGEYELPNPFGGEPIPSTASYTLTTPRDRSGCAVIRATIDADDDALPKILREGIGQVSPSGDAPDESEFDDLTLRHEMSFSYDPGSGWVARADVRKTITSGERKRTDRTLLVTR